MVLQGAACGSECHRGLEKWNVRRTEDAHKVVRRAQKLIRSPT
jgi:hypothetical protein